jgi:hypothetical protein
MSRIRFRLLGFAKQAMPHTAPKPALQTPAAIPAVSPTRPAQPMLGLFGLTIDAPDGKPREGFMWDGTMEIE